MKPVAWLCQNIDGTYDALSDKGCVECFPVYTAPRELIDKAEQLYYDLCYAWQSDMEHGVKSLNDKAVEDFKNNYPELNVVISRVMSFLWECVDEDIDNE